MLTGRKHELIFEPVAITVRIYWYSSTVEICFWVFQDIEKQKDLKRIPGVPKKRYPCFIFAITSVNVHRF